MSIARHHHRTGMSLIELIASCAIAVTVILLMTQLLATTRSMLRRTTIQRVANEEILNIAEQLSVIPYESLKTDAAWSDLLNPPDEHFFSQWKLDLRVTPEKIKPGDPSLDVQVDAKRITIVLSRPEGTGNPVIARTVTWRFPE